MKFASIRVITNDVPRLVQFYEQISGLPVRQYTEDFAELQTPTATLGIGSTRTLQFGGQHVARAAHNSSAILEFRVADVDADYQRLAPVLGEAVVQPPTTMPWGNRSLLFLDPDGNLVNFFAPVTPEARQRLDG
ncbi:VOC family protein [Hymenobacter cellulosivorans]|uniref:VOC family protein n=1 Tax=Hymenobacter cellulosivorans TaxID=2932249 RepID=A0ABY4F3W6_9BACT|nr:VOC family protein [Hymenobacter cellulosivorans]UOQ51270.1 VOC family protein [Hymenobacter cellulosivorans]